MGEDQTILAVDDQGNFLEYIPKKAGHTGKGKRHLAITVLLQNSKGSPRSRFGEAGQVLLQKRKHKIFDNVWDFTGATHPLHRTDGTDETLEEASKRCLREEWDISPSTSLRIKDIGEFNYFAPYHTVQGDFCENEHCAMMVGQYDGKIKMNPKVGYEYKWMDKKEFLKDLQSNPKNYTPWAIEGVKVLKQAKFFD